ncbi:MAG: tetratricopeptide repeat protein [Candidatus Riflebacteria bacterium]|nr:tetratricopeptide repeat protein [Candidatus Riflebacteria bacterium]
MNKCKECGQEAGESFDYCVSCGFYLKSTHNPRKERFLFFLSPLFIFISTILLFAVLGVKEAFYYGSILSGELIATYIVGTLMFAFLCFLFVVKPAFRGYFEASSLAFLVSVVMTFVVYITLNLKFGGVPVYLTPDVYAKEKSNLFMLLLLPSMFVVTAFVVAKYKILSRLNLLDDKKKSLFLGLPLTLIFLCAISVSVFFAYGDFESRKTVTVQMLNDFGLVEKATEVTERALLIKPDSFELYYLRGSITIDSDYKFRSIEEAIKSLEKARKIHPDSLMINYYLSVAYSENNDKENALKYAYGAIDGRFNDAFVNKYLGDLYLKYNMPKKAVEAYKLAVSKSYDDAIILNNLSFLLLELNENLPQALELAKRSVELVPNQIFNKDTLAWAYYKNGRYIEALEEINDIRDVVEESPEIHFHYVMILNSMSLLKNPIELLNKLLAKPEVILNKSLSNSINAARDKINAESRHD